MQQLEANFHTVEIDGRPVSYRRFGNGSRKILFYHGFPGSSVQIDFIRPHVAIYDLEIVCFDRPGYNGSHFNKEPQCKLTSKISKGLLASLGWSQCEVVSVSGGTPFLFSFVRSHPELVSRVTIISGLGPMSGVGFKRIMGWKSKAALRMLPFVPERILKRVRTMPLQRRTKMMGRFLPASRPDQEFMSHPKAKSMVVQGLNEALMQNGRGPKRDARVLTSKWNADLGQYAGPVDIWHGDQDKIVPAAMARSLSEALAGSRLNIVSGEGHYSLPVRNVGQILAKRKPV